MEPRVSILIKFGQHNEHAGHNVEKEEEKDEREKDALHTRINLHFVRELSHDCLPRFEQLEYFCQSDKSDQLVKFSDFEESN